MRGFLRVYAARLGLDPQPYVDEYASRFGTTELPQLARSPGRVQLHSRRLESRILLLALGGIVSVTVLVIAAWKLGDTAPEVVDVVPPAPPAAVPVPAPPPVTPRQERVVEPEPPFVVPATIPPILPESAPVVPIEPVTVEITGTGRGSLVIVRRDSRRGAELFARRLTDGQSREYDAPVFVEVARPVGVRIVVDGRRVDPPRSPAGLVIEADGTLLEEPALASTP